MWYLEISYKFLQLLKNIYVVIHKSLKALGDAYKFIVFF